MNEIGDPPAGARPGVAGWFPDPWSQTLLRWWTGHAWTFTTTEATGPQPPPPARPAPLPAPPPAAPAPPPPPPAPPGPKPSEPKGTLSGGRLIALLVVVGLIAGLVGVRLLRRPDRPTTDGGSAAARPGPPTTQPPANADPSASVLPSLVVRGADVTAPAAVVVLAGGSGLSRPTLDLCNGRFPSESRRTARLQDGMLDGQADLTLSTEAVLYDDPSAAIQAFNELRSVTAACPATPVPSPVGDPTVITKFNPAPDTAWPQTPTVNRLAYDFTTTDENGVTSHSIAVYLQRGRALVGVYFFEPDGPQAPVAGQTTVAGIVGVFAGRLAALPASVISS
ncbi:MAG TPA: DUF2510 domain-containing protein [Acidimicrobiales bacterium]|nr:DUF2510 domain-containing protein [Acidimicrobiales bacterium]